MLVGPQRCELGANHIRRLLDVDPEPWVGEVAAAVHLGDGDVGIPIGDRPFCRVGFVLDLGQAVGRWDDERRVLPIQVEARVVLAGAPRLVDRLLIRG